jgi:hypothetical protein
MTAVLLVGMLSINKAKSVPFVEWYILIPVASGSVYVSQAKVNAAAGLANNRHKNSAKINLFIIYSPVWVAY